VTVSLSTAHKDVTILRPGGFRVSDSRPMSSMRVSVMLQDGDKREAGGFALGGRTALDPHIGELAWEEAIKQAIRQADVNLEAVEAPAGEMTVVCGPGWPGVLLHEAVGHGLEGDFNRKQTSLYAGMMGEMVAAPGVTIIDDGTLTDHRGSLAIDDEGTPTQRNVLIENGKLVGYMQDRMNARLMGVGATGNGRRESYAHAPMPRMTNTFMAAGQDDPGEIIASVQDGIYAVDFGGGQVDITNGQFTFKITEAYRIRNGKIAEPIKGVTLIGNGPEVMRRVSMVGNDLAIKKGVGMCGKAGQSLPVTVGQPTCKIDAITVGGTQV
jgi:TldD protein